MQCVRMSQLHKMLSIDSNFHSNKVKFVWFPGPQIVYVLPIEKKAKEEEEE